MFRGAHKHAEQKRSHFINETNAKFTCSAAERIATLELLRMKEKKSEKKMR